MHSSWVCCNIKHLLIIGYCFCDVVIFRWFWVCDCALNERKKKFIARPTMHNKSGPKSFARKRKSTFLMKRFFVLPVFEKWLENYVWIVNIIESFLLIEALGLMFLKNAKKERERKIWNLCSKHNPWLNLHSKILRAADNLNWWSLKRKRLRTYYCRSRKKAAGEQ